MNALTLLLVGLGGALGSVARALAGWAIPPGRLPWATLLVNIAGSLLIGWLMARFAAFDGSDARAQSFWIVGVCGGFTTFSSFSWQTLDQLNRGHVGAAAANVILSVVVCLAATWLGWRLGR
jgi:CrcB protein